MSGVQKAYDHLIMQNVFDRFLRDTKNLTIPEFLKSQSVNFLQNSGQMLRSESLKEVKYFH